MPNPFDPDAANLPDSPVMARLRALIGTNALEGRQELDRLILRQIRDLVAEIARHDTEVVRLKRARDTERLQHEADVSRYLILTMVRRQRRERRRLAEALGIGGDQ